MRIDELQLAATVAIHREFNAIQELRKRVAAQSDEHSLRELTEQLRQWREQQKS